MKREEMEMKTSTQKHDLGFTLIELLIVVAIIAILAAIAVPNFLEAQVRSKVSRSFSDMRTLLTATEAYRTDYQKLPPYVAAGSSTASWWGWSPKGLTTPVAYVTSLPRQPFSDKTLTQEPMGNQLYTYIYDIRLMCDAGIGPYSGAPASVPRNLKSKDQMDFVMKARNCSYIYYTCGPDSIDSTAYIAPMSYDPTNGTVSFGDIHMFGAGTRSESNIAW
jgi:prepilin-type N-terminal cleavage/methylation domain-containing protein